MTAANRRVALDDFLARLESQIGAENASPEDKARFGRPPRKTKSTITKPPAVTLGIDNRSSYP